MFFELRLFFVSISVYLLFVRCYTSFRNQLKKCKTQIKGEILL
ncbi:hypothetical protein CU012_0015 [Enterococcus faecium]|nr:hypothetical protein [Enterococcus faecium]MBK4815914.1 hypothetical protein [Enterococcus faecium]MBK4865437.1 hypothetical protein [Enterococcus faecium]MBL4990054.1 hypothetical protein [Enterococcus lactis]MBL4992678.1 hypothetical protein [Enterococcus lactis]